MIVYKVTNRLNGKVYIGISRDTAERRWSVHCYEAGRNSTNQAIHRAIRKHGVDCFTIESLASAKTWKDLCWLEKYFIAEYGSYSKGYNMTKGGEGKYGYETSDETKKKIGSTRKGKFYSKEQKESLRKVREIQRKDGSLTGGPRTESGIQAIVESNKRRTKQVEIDGVMYESVKAAKAVVGEYQVRKALNGGRPYYGKSGNRRS